MCSDPQDGDGQFSTEEVEAIVTNLITATKRVKEFKMVAFAAFIALCLVCVSMLAMTLVGNELSKEQATADSGLLTVKGTDQVVQVASSDLAVSSDGLISSRADAATVTESTDRRRRLEESGTIEPGTIYMAPDSSAILPLLGVRAVQQQVMLKSDMPVSYFHEMSDLLIEDETGISVNFKVLAAGRMPAPWATSGFGESAG